jgi:hypothetical protein
MLCHEEGINFLEEYIAGRDKQIAEARLSIERMVADRENYAQALAELRRKLRLSLSF